VATLKQELPPFIGDVSSTMSSLIANLFKEYDVVFQEKLGNLIRERQRAYEILRTSRVEAETLCKEIELCSSRLQVVENELQTINTLKKHLSQIMEEISI
jgi:DNA repair ATPase RecN